MTAKLDADATRPQHGGMDSYFPPKGSGVTPTLADVAALAGVSPSTVSRYINAPEVVAKASAERIIRALAETGYVPNLVAGGLASRRSRLVALFLPVLDQSIFASTIQAMVNALADEGYQVVLALTGILDERLETLVPSILGRKPDGIILTGSAMPPAVRKKLEAAGVPIIETWDLPASPIDSVVGFSHSLIGRTLAEHVIKTGYRNPYLLSTGGVRAAARRDSFAHAFLDQGLPEPPHRIVAAPTTFSAGRKALREILEEKIDVDVVICASDWLAHGVMSEAAQRGLRIPEDLAVIGFGDLEFAQALSPPLTTIAIDGQALGREAARLFVEHAQGADRRPQVIDVGFRLVTRASG